MVFHDRSSTQWGKGCTETRCDPIGVMWAVAHVAATAAAAAQIVPSLPELRGYSYLMRKGMRRRRP